MITTTILAIVESFLATLAYAVLFNVPKQHYTACGITGRRVALYLQCVR